MPPGAMVVPGASQAGLEKMTNGQQHLARASGCPGGCDRACGKQKTAAVTSKRLLLCGKASSALAVNFFFKRAKNLDFYLKPSSF